MKLSVAIAKEDAAPSAFVVWRGFKESIKKASKLGYEGVELALKSADDIDADELKEWLAEYNMEVSSISTGQVFADLGLYFTNPNKIERMKSIEVFKDLIDLAKDFGQIINIGRTRGFIAENQTYEQAEGLFIKTIEKLCDHAKPLGVTIIIEPVNRYEINFINNVDEGAKLLKKISRDNIGLMPDVFHMNIEDDSIIGSLERNIEYIKYIHFADSNRLAPGQGHINFESIIAILKENRFDGWISIEILPKPDPDTAARQAANYILPMLGAN